MSNRKERRAAEHQARKAARKAGFPTPQLTNSETAAELLATNIPEPGLPFPALASLSPARVAASQANGKRSHGAKSPETRAISAQNHTIHGLARHLDQNFKLLTCEDPAIFASFQQSLIDEHQPTSPTESILVTRMAQSDWLANRAQRLLDTCIDSDTGVITNEKMFSLYARYQTAHIRAFHKCLNDLVRLRAEKRKAELGFEAQTVAKEKHEMKKQAHYWQVLKKDAEACHQLSLNTVQNIKARSENPAFEAEYTAELAKRGLIKQDWEVATQAA